MGLCHCHICIVVVACLIFVYVFSIPRFSQTYQGGQYLVVEGPVEDFHPDLLP